MSEQSRPMPLERHLLALLGFCAVAVAGAGAASACEVSVVRTPAAVRITYDPFAASVGTGLLALEVANAAADPCSLELALQDRQGTPITSVTPEDSGVEVAFRPRSALTAATNDPGAFRLVVQPGSTVRAELTATIEGGAVPRAGDYEDTLQVALRSAEGAPIGPPLPVQLVLSSPGRAQVNVAGSSAAFGAGDNVDVIDFGMASTGKTARAFLQVRANEDARVTFTSQNGGTLKRLKEAEASAPIPYRLTLDGRALDLSQPSVRDVRTPLTLQGTSLEMVFELGEVQSKRAGKYEDLIEIDISPD